MVNPCIGLTDYNLHCLFFIQLLSILNQHSSTIKNYIKLLTWKYKQSLRKYLIVIVALYKFSSIIFFFLANKNYNLFSIEIETPKESPEFTLENKCQTPLYCFLTHLDYGIRSDGGIGYIMPIISFMEDKVGFIFELIYISSFFIFITFILLTCVLVITIEIFNELNEEYNISKNVMNNVSDICGGNQEYF